jgi:hypothetical protein
MESFSTLKLQSSGHPDMTLRNLLLVKQRIRRFDTDWAAATRSLAQSIDVVAAGLQACTNACVLLCLDLATVPVAGVCRVHMLCRQPCRQDVQYVHVRTNATHRRPTTDQPAGLCGRTAPCLSAAGFACHGEARGVSDLGAGTMDRPGQVTTAVS